MYVPEGWYHAVLNLSPNTVSVGAQATKFGGLMEDVFFMVKRPREDPEATDRHLTNVLRSHPNCFEAWLMLARIRLFILRDAVAGAEAAERAVQSNSRNVEAHVLLAKAQHDSHQYEALQNTLLMLNTLVEDLKSNHAWQLSDEKERAVRDFLPRMLRLMSRN